MPIPNISVPTLLLDKQRCLRNIERMANKAKQSKSMLRPHFKTPQSNGVGTWFRDFGVDKIAVSSLRMANYYAQGGWKDITVAFPFNILEINSVNKLAQQIQLNLLVESEATVTFLKSNLKTPVGIFLKIDVGYHRTGIPAGNTLQIARLLEQIKGHPLLHFKGFLAHAGHTYKKQGWAEIEPIYQQHRQALHQLKQLFLSDFPDLILSYGDTPSCSLLDNFSDFDEIRAGNFVFYDLSQYHIGACQLDDIAVAMACPVVALHPERSEIVVYGGGVHFSKDRAIHPNGFEYYGRVVNWDKHTWQIPETESYVKSLSQEHGIIKASDELIASTKVGDILLILPIHSCMMVDLMPHYLTLDGEEIPIWDKQ